MKQFVRLTLAAAIATTSTFASAATIVSFGTAGSGPGASTPAGAATAVNTTGVLYDGYNSAADTLTSATPTSGTATYNISTGNNVWAGPAANSSYVSFDKNTEPGGSDANGNPNSAAPNG